MSTIVPRLGGAKRSSFEAIKVSEASIELLCDRKVC